LPTSIATLLFLIARPSKICGDGSPQRRAKPASR
jgi:hypothetical protein